MTENSELFADLERRRGTEWMLVGMSFIRTVTVIQAKILDKINEALHNNVTAEKVVGDSFRQQIRLAYGLGLIEKKHYDALVYLAKIRNKWAHEDNSEMDFKDMDPLLNMLSPERITEINNHVDDHWGHFRFACDIVCDEISAILKNER